MKKYLLDTSICVEFLRGNPIITAHLAALHPQDVVVCSVVKAELYFGAYRSQHPTKALSTLTALLGHFQNLPFDDNVVPGHGQSYALDSWQSYALDSWQSYALDSWQSG